MGKTYRIPVKVNLANELLIEADNDEVGDEVAMALQTMEGLSVDDMRDIESRLKEQWPDAEFDGLWEVEDTTAEDAEEDGG
jgi:hypothetical protein